jgi:hypothetical protein
VVIIRITEKILDRVLIFISFLGFGLRYNLVVVIIIRRAKIINYPIYAPVLTAVARNNSKMEYYD